MCICISLAPMKRSQAPICEQRHRYAPQTSTPSARCMYSEHECAVGHDHLNRNRTFGHALTTNQVYGMNVYMNHMDIISPFSL